MEKGRDKRRDTEMETGMEMEKGKEKEIDEVKRVVQTESESGMVRNEQGVEL